MPNVILSSNPSFELLCQIYGEGGDGKDNIISEINGIKDINERITLWNFIVTRDTGLYRYFSIRRGFTPTSMGSGSFKWIRARYDEDVKTRENTQPIKKVLEGIKNAYNQNKNPLEAISLLHQCVGVSNGHLGMALAKNTVNQRRALEEYFDFLSTLLNDDRKEGVPEAILDLLNTKQDVLENDRGGKFVNRLDLSETIIRYSPVEIRFYFNFITDLLKSKQGDDVFVLHTVRALLIANEEKKNTLIGSMFAFLEYLHWNSPDDWRIRHVANAVHNYTPFIIELFNIIKQSNPCATVKSAFKQLWINVPYFLSLPICDLQVIREHDLLTLLDLELFTFVQVHAQLKYITMRYPIKDQLLNCILKQEEESKKYGLLEKALNPATDLGKVFWCSTGMFACNFRSGSLEKIIKALAIIQKKPVRELTLEMEKRYGDHRTPVKASRFFNGLFGSSTKVRKNPAEIINPLFDPGACDNATLNP